MADLWVLSPAADDDLEEILDYVADQSRSFTVTHRLLERFESAFVHLAQSPGIGTVRRELAGDRYRWWPVGKYLVVYDGEARPIRILRVLHGARQLARLTHDLATDE